jgi:hypothetical protein
MQMRVIFRQRKLVFFRTEPMKEFFGPIKQKLFLDRASK